MASARVPNFLPSMSGFHFPNNYSNLPNLSDIVLSLPVIGDLPLGNPSNGLCGGFVFAVMDFFSAQPAVLMRPDLQPPSPPQSNPPTPGDPLFNYLLERLLDTFVLGLVGTQTLLWMTLPTHDTFFSGWLSPHGLAWLMVNQEWPAIQSDLDSGVLSPLGLVTDNLSSCHQVLAHGYDLDEQGNLTIYCYNPNEPSQDGVATLSMNISQSYNTIPIQSANISQNDDGGGVVFKGIFHASYSMLHAGGTIVSPVAIGVTPPSALALQSLAPQWNAWESPFSSILFENGLTIQNSLLEIPYPQMGSKGVFTVSGSGADIWSNADAFQFVSETQTGDGMITAFVVSQTNTDAWAKAGVMMRETQDADSTFAMVAVTLGNGVVFEYRSTTGGSATNIYGPAGAAPYWIQLVRAGNTFTASASLDGNTWTQVGQETIIMAAQASVGLAVSSHNAGTIGTAVFDRLNLTANTPWVPALSGADVGAVGANGSWFSPANAPAICSWGPNRIDLFIQDQVGFADHLSWDNGTVAIDELDQSVVSCPCTVSWGDGRVDAFGVLNDLDYSLVHFWLDGGNLQQSESLGRPNGNWNTVPIPLDGSLESADRLLLSRGLYFASPPCASTWGPNRIDIFAVAKNGDPQSPDGISGVDAAVVHLTFNGSWTYWQDVPALRSPNLFEGSSLIAVSWAPGRIDLFYVDSQLEILHCVYTLDAMGNGAWSARENLGAPAAGFSQMQPSVVSWGPGSLDVFGVGMDGNLYHQWYDTTSDGNGHWADAWENLGSPPTGGLQGSPTACSWAEGRLDVFARGTDVDVNNYPVPALWHRYFDGGSWANHTWESLGGVIQSDPVAVSWGANRIDVYAAGGNIFTLGSQDFIPWHIWFQG